MGKKSRRKKENRNKNMNRNAQHLPAGTVHWQEEGELHFLTPGLPPSPEKLAEMTKSYQQKIRNSPLFDDWVRQFGLTKAEEMLNECRVELRP
jgi:hypothetical protein